MLPFIGAKSTKLLMLTSAMALTTVPVAVSQAADEPASESEEVKQLDVVVVQGLRGSLQESLDVKRNTTVVSDALVGVEIGDLPDLSIAESLERITGLTSDRFKGGASEISIRGLGAFLGASTMNGREITSGSDGRDVNFGQFPSELVGGAVVYKSQQASFVEGGVSGIIELQTLKPLDYGKRRLQAQALYGFSEYEDRVDDGEVPSQRYTLSYVDQFEGAFGEFGIAIGGQLRDDTAPEDQFVTSSSYRPCNTIEGVDRSNNCSYLVDDNGASAGASDTYFVSNQYIYRAMQTDSDRDAVMANFQWQPTSAWDINLDLQYSDRYDLEERANLVVADGRRDITPIEISSSGALLAWSGETRIENQSVWRERTENFTAIGLNAEWSGERLTVAADLGYNKTERRQDELDMRIRTSDRVLYELDRRQGDIPVLTLTDVSDVEEDTGLTFDLDNHDLYDNGARARRRLERIDDEIMSFRLDGNYAFESNFIQSVDVGFRFAERQRVNDDGIDSTISGLSGYDSEAVIATRRDNFIVEDLYDGADTSMAGITWATWDPESLFVALTGSRDAGLPTGSTLSADDADVTETTMALYAQANYETSLFGKPAYGNFGVRVVETEIDSLGISTALETSVQPDMTILVTPVGDPIFNTESNSFTSVLPSANLVLELADDKLLRFAAYSAIARPDPGAMSAALDFDDEADLGDLASIVSAEGNPFLEPLESLNFDASYEWYQSDDTAISGAFYYKSLQTGFETIGSELDVVVDGVSTPVAISRSANSDDKSRIWGFELAVQHVFSDLPGVFGGLGIQAAYNYADSDFEFPDPSRTDGVNFLKDFTEPANIAGYSKTTGNVTLFWENDTTNLRLAYKARSSYSKPFRNTANRYAGAQDFLDFSASHDLTDNVEVRFQVLNITDEPNLLYRPVGDSLAQADYSGRRLFVGLRGRF